VRHRVPSRFNWTPPVYRKDLLMVSSDYRNLDNKITGKVKKWVKEIRLKLEIVFINISKTDLSVIAFVQCVVVSCMKWTHFFTQDGILFTHMPTQALCFSLNSWEYYYSTPHVVMHNTDSVSLTVGCSFPSWGFINCRLLSTWNASDD